MNIKTIYNKSFVFASVLLLIISFVSHGQINKKIYNNWYFGNYCAYNFSSSTTSFVPMSAMATEEGCSSISDTSGNLLFYTNGINVWNKNNNIMPNGSGLTSHYSSTQGALIVQKPLSPNLYYVFTVDAQAGQAILSPCNCFCYSIVDMTLNGGLGGVVQKNVVIDTNLTEKVTATLHPNDTSVWIVTHKYNSNNFQSYLLNPSGLNFNPVISSAGSNHCCTPFNLDAIGQMKISQDRKKLGLCLFASNKMELFDFNDSTGIVSNAVSVQNLSRAYGFEFSPNSVIAYATTEIISGGTQVLQFDLRNWNSNAISNSKTVLFHDWNSRFGQLQLAPDGKVYVSKYYGRLGYVNKPDELGSSCQFNFDAIPFGVNPTGPSASIYGGLPNCISGFYKTKYIPPPVDSTTIDIPFPEVPNVFTPNQDDRNDVWGFKFPPYYKFSNINIYNRWGICVYSLSKDQLTMPNNIKIQWDGFTTAGEACTPGQYFYILNYINNKNETMNRHGYISLIK